MAQDSSESHISNDDLYRSALIAMSMMNDFITKSYPCISYGYDEIDQLPFIDENDKMQIKDVLSHSMKYNETQYAGQYNSSHVF